MTNTRNKTAVPLLSLFGKEGALPRMMFPEALDKLFEDLKESHASFCNRSGIHSSRLPHIRRGRALPTPVDIEAIISCLKDRPDLCKMLVSAYLNTTLECFNIPVKDIEALASTAIANMISTSK